MPCKTTIPSDIDACTSTLRKAKITGQTIDQVFKPGATYYCDHIPSGENWFVLGVNRERDELCAAGWPPSIGNISHCENWELAGEITEMQLEYRNRNFGLNWE